MTNTAKKTRTQEARERIGGGWTPAWVPTLIPRSPSAWPTPSSESTPAQYDLQDLFAAAEAMTVLVFAYGSNMSAAQMRRRCPGASERGAAVLPGYRISFAGHSRIWNGATATVVPHKRRKVHGVIFEMTLLDMIGLDRYEGAPAIYRRTNMQVLDGAGRQVWVHVYTKCAGKQGKPSKEYYQQIRRAYDRHGFSIEPLKRARAGKR